MRLQAGERPSVPFAGAVWVAPGESCAYLSSLYPGLCCPASQGARWLERGAILSFVVAVIAASTSAFSRKLVTA